MNRRQQFFRESKSAIINYFKAQLIMSGVTLVVLAIGLSIIGINWWGLKALAIAIIDVLPVLGSGIVMIPWALLRALTGSPEIGGQLAILYVILTIIKLIGEPMIVGKSVGVSPILTLVITLGAMLILGPIGAIVGGIIAVFVKVFWTIMHPPVAVEDDVKKSRFDSRRDR